MQPSPDAGLTEDFIIPIPSLTAPTSPGIVYVSYTRDSPEDYPIASFQCILKFISKELDPSTGEPEEEGYEDEYQLEDVELSAGGDYIIPSYASFDSEWKKLESGSSATETFALSAMESLRGKYALTPLRTALLIGLKLLATLSSMSLIWSHWADHKHHHRHLCIRFNCQGWLLVGEVRFSCEAG